jgi:transposase
MPFVQYDTRFKTAAVDKYYEQGLSIGTVREQLASPSLALSTIKEWRRLLKDAGSVHRDPGTCRRPGRRSRLTDEQRDMVREGIQESPLAYLDEIGDRLCDAVGTSIGSSTLDRLYFRFLH